ncbi:glycogen debranching protein GlgX [Methylopila turkensis]|uniref:Glycogen operon protein GlgX homolog n=1 Tax=Methylopila turkensis TaxID=1437816 RepID=A0A9W6JTG8_9HYPH|nr:glycogen debranching protein GlgX [Methylopila turkensis]GLK81499.1 glycogen operon protein GlgX homolog [Methylopila turkensis]
MTTKLEPGSPYPLGATWDGLGVNFAVFSSNAEQIDLCLFDPSGRREIARVALPEKTDEVFHGYLAGARAGLLYGFRAHGPYDPQHGHRFNPNKLLLDPYAKQISGEVRWSDALYGYRLHSPRGDLSYDRRDSAPGMPKAIVTDDAFNWGDDRPPNVPWSETVIYEAHLRGLTMQRPDILPHERGTFAALASPQMIEHYKRLGVTAVELLPIHAFVQDRRLIEQGLRNYWGYNTLGFFAPEQRYLSDGSLTEIKVAVRRLHAAGIEVILDVVYNHTAEGSEEGPTLSFRGLDNSSYYRLAREDRRYCVNDTGTGNTVNVSHPRVLQMVMDSLRYWVDAYHVDGFRFDLGVTLGREEDGFDPGSGFFDAIRQDPVLQRVKLISEPWDIGPGGYQLGHHPPGFAEWNDRYRDSVRRFWRGDGGQRPEIAARLAGSSDLFDRRSRKPWASINFVASHDGYTLADATSYERKHNLANGEDNRDGHGENYSSNWGVEGPTDDEAILDIRARAARAMLATLLFSSGTPMLLAGDEFGRTQNGNNNAYAQDNPTSWVDWTLAASPAGRDLTAFVARLIRLRAAHTILRCKNFLHGREEPAPGVLDIAWFDEAGLELTAGAWNDGGERTLTLRRATRGAGGSAPILTLMLNPTADDRTFRAPPPALPTTVLLDTAAPDAPERPLEGDTIVVAARSAVLLYAVASSGRRRNHAPPPNDLTGE